MDRWHSIPVSNDIINDSSSSDSPILNPSSLSINDSSVASSNGSESFQRWCNGRLDHVTGLCAQFGELCLNAHFDSAGDFVAPSISNGNGHSNGALHHDDTDFVAEQAKSRRVPMVPSASYLKEKQQRPQFATLSPSSSLSPPQSYQTALTPHNSYVNGNGNNTNTGTSSLTSSQHSGFGMIGGIPRAATVPPAGTPVASLDRPSSYGHMQHQHQHQQQQQQLQAQQSPYGRAPILTRPASAPAKTGAQLNEVMPPLSRSQSPAPSGTLTPPSPATTPSSSSSSVTSTNLGPPPFASNLFPPLSVSNISSPAALVPLLGLSLSPPQTVAFVDQRNESTRKRHDDYMTSFRTRPCRSPSCTSVTCFGVHARQASRRIPIYSIAAGKFNYMPMKCRHKHNDPKALCPAGDKCEYSHCTEEVVYHPLVFKTKLCDHGDRFSVCKAQGVHCAKAHGEADRREYVAPTSNNNASAANASSLSTPSPPITPSGGGTPSGHSRYGWDSASIASTGRASSPAISSSSTGEESDETYALRCTFVPTEEQRQFFMYTYKTRPCVNADCPYCYHFHGPLERRRAPNVYNYTTTPCPRLYSKSLFGEEKWADPARCPAGDSCQYAHTVLEVMYHPALYKTQMCSQFQEDPSTWACKWKVACSFAHGRADLSHKSALLKQSSSDGLSSLHIRPDLHRSGSTSSTGSGVSDGDDSAADINAEFVIVCLGLPWKTSNETVAQFLGDVNITEIFRPVDHQGRTTGEAYVVVKDEKDVERGLKHHRQHIGSRYIEVYKTTPRKLSQAQRRAAALANIQHLSEIDDQELDENDERNDAFLADASWCEVCQLQMTSIKQLREHLNGSRHQEALLKVQRLEREEVRQDSRQDRRRRMGQPNAPSTANGSPSTPSSSSSSMVSSLGGLSMHGIHMGYMRKTDDDKRPEFIRPPSYEERMFFERVAGRYPSVTAAGPGPSSPSVSVSVSSPPTLARIGVKSKSLGSQRDPVPSSYNTDAYGQPIHDGPFDGFSPMSREREYAARQAAYLDSPPTATAATNNSSSNNDGFHPIPTSSSFDPHPHNGHDMHHHHHNGHSNGHGISHHHHLTTATGQHHHPRMTTNGPSSGQLPRARSLESVGRDGHVMSSLSRDAPAFSPLGTTSSSSSSSSSFETKVNSNNMSSPSAPSSSPSNAFGLGMFGGSVFAPTPSETNSSRLHKYTLPAALGSHRTKSPAPPSSLSSGHGEDSFMGANSLVDSLLDDKPTIISTASSVSSAAVIAAPITTVASVTSSPSPLPSSVSVSNGASPVTSGTNSSATAPPTDRIYSFLAPLLGTGQAEKYSDLLRENEVDWDALCLLKEAHLKDLGIPMGTRLKIVAAIHASHPGASPSSSSVAPTAPSNSPSVSAV